MEDPNLSGQTALVTGGGRGIGRSIAVMLARQGARIVLVGRRKSMLDETAGEIRDLGLEAVPVAGDVSHEDEVSRIFDSAGAVNVLVNNAGIIGPIAPLAASDPYKWHENIDINLYGVFLMCRYALPGMIDRGSGHIVNISSGAARGTTSGWSAYSAAKAGVEALTTVLAAELAETGVRVNAVRPGIVDTDMQVEIRQSPEDQFGPENVRRFRGYKERELLRHPDDPARLVSWLLSEAARDVNGEILAIDDPEVAARVGLVPMGR